MAREPITLSLSEPVNAWGKMVNELTINSPKGKDILQCGYPWITEINPRTGGTTQSVQVPALRLLLARMALVPETTIDELEAVDFYKATEVVRFFFLYQMQPQSSETSSESPGGPATSASPST